MKGIYSINAGELIRSLIWNEQYNRKRKPSYCNNNVTQDGTKKVPTKMRSCGRVCGEAV
ncbi:hypothetical protein GGP96_000384 [Salinibacter ruber]|uniref:Uncharacterized protein n=1 Tax=Salinibacter ruber TaxID=146919 RepID=A0A9X2RGF1_9BACT|nr:hypothetical protein [Salinibacter ruber]MCS3865386.1 hypothetical protein [Salinibacter ruber]MCS4149905.1 hypothetical protein [Salinibacter ruber]MCS4175686.1 hypothetical protein [Salinibacter ruber]